MNRIVFDTNVVVSALLFSGSTLRRIRDLWATKRVVPIVNRDTVLELTCVLQYPKFRLDQRDQHELLGDYLPFTEDSPEPLEPCGVSCGDSDDQMFLDLAVSAAADALVSGDPHVIAVASKLPVVVLRPSELIERPAASTLRCRERQVHLHDCPVVVADGEGPVPLLRQRLDDRQSEPGGSTDRQIGYESWSIV